MNTDQALQWLRQGRIEMEGLITWGSNYTFLAEVVEDSADSEPRRTPAIYKPQRGERPLWDFPTGTLCLRERAAFLVSEAIGWHIVPPTVLRDGPQGWGSVQLFIEHNPELHYFRLAQKPQYTAQLQRVVLFDYLANNADRKSGHILLEEPGRLWAIDHGICFHTEYKLRSVIWEFAGLPIPAEMCDDLAQLLALLKAPKDGLSAELSQLISRQEIGAIKTRLHSLLDTSIFPQPRTGRQYPWPPV